MEEEVRILRDKLEQAETETVAGCEFTKGLLAGHEVILLKSGIGKSKCSDVNDNFIRKV